MDLTFARALIEHPGDATTKQLFAGGQPGIFWVDWREADDDIVRLASRALERSDLGARWIDGQLHLSYGAATSIVPLRGCAGEQDITLDALNRAMSGAFEIRWIKASDGGDTLAFMALPCAAWLALESELGERVAHAFARVDPAAPLFGGPDIDRATLEAQIEEANPGVLGALAFARAAFRLTTLAADARVRSAPGMSRDLLPVTHPLGGDLVVGYFRDMLDSADAITEGELRRYGTTIAQLRELAERWSFDAWAKFQIVTDAGVTRITGKERIAVSTFALCDVFWQDRFAQEGPLVAAFPRQDLALTTRADDADGIAALIEAIDGVDRDDSAALSSQLFCWDGDGGWRAREPAAHERTFRRSRKYFEAERGNLRAQCEIANLYLHLGLYPEAARRFRKGAEQVVSSPPVDSPDMFENGSALLCNLADKYEHGLGIEQDYAQAAYWYRRSASMNNYVAQYDLGMLYLRGRGVPLDVEVAKEWLERSALQGFEPARVALAGIPA